MPTPWVASFAMPAFRQRNSGDSCKGRRLASGWSLRHPPPCYSFPPKEGALTTITLDDRYLREEGLVYLSGLQALVRLPLDQSRRDRKAGIRTGTFISGYPGSPLGGYDLALQHASPLLQQHDIVHIPAGNEELAATAISGTQMLDAYPHSRVDGR